MSEHFISREDARGDLLSCAAYLAEEIGGSDDRAEAIAAVIPHYLAKGEVDLAAELSNSVDDPFVRDRLLIAVAAKCAELDDDEYALQLAEAIEEYGLQSQAREAIALTKAEKGDLAGARAVADSVIHPDHALGGIAVKQAERGDEAAALETISEIDYPGSAAIALLAITSMKVEKGENEKAVEYLETACSLALEIEHDEEKIRTLIDIGNLYFDAKRGDRAIETLDRAREFAEELDNVHRDNLLAAAAHGFIRAGSVELADRTLDAVTDKTQIATALLGFAREYWRRDEHDDAFEALDEAYEVLRSQRETETRDSKLRYGLFGSIAAQFAGFERGERAVEIAEGIEDADQAKAALSQIAQIMTSQGNGELARQALNSIEDETARTFALIGMSDAAAREGSKDESLSLLREAVDGGDTVSQSSSRAMAFSEIASRLIDLGEADEARKLASANLENIAEIKSESAKVVALASLSSVFAGAGIAVSEEQSEILRSILMKNII